MSESGIENHVGRLSPALRLCLSVDPFGGEQDREVLASDEAGLLLYRCNRS